MLRTDLGLGTGPVSGQEQGLYLNQRALLLALALGLEKGGTRGQGSSCPSATSLLLRGAEPSRALGHPARHRPPQPSPVPPRTGSPHEGFPSLWAPPTLLFWMRRVRCSKQLLLRKVACSTGRSSHASIRGMASADGSPVSPPAPSRQRPRPLSLSPSSHAARSCLPSALGPSPAEPPPQEPRGPYPPSMLTRRATRASSGPGLGPAGQSALRMRK